MNLGIYPKDILNHLEGKVCFFLLIILKYKERLKTNEEKYNENLIILKFKKHCTYEIHRHFTMYSLDETECKIYNLWLKPLKKKKF